MSDLPPPPINPGNEPTRAGDATPPDPHYSGSELPRRGYEDERRMKPPPPPPPPQTGGYQAGYVPPGGTPPQGQGYSQQLPPPPPPRPARPPRRPNPSGVSRRDSGLYLPWWSLLILVGVVGIGACAMIYGVSNLADNFVLADQTPQVIVVTSEINLNPNPNTGVNDLPPGSVPTAAQIINTPIPQAQATPTTRPQSAAGCPRGVRVFVTGTQGVGLSIRSEPAQGQNIQYVAADGEFFVIIDGPQTSVGSDGSVIEWCKLQGANLTSVEGWAAVDFLTVEN